MWETEAGGARGVRGPRLGMWEMEAGGAGGVRGPGVRDVGDRGRWPGRCRGTRG